MKKFLKVFALMLVSLLCFVCLFGCGPKKSEDEIARNYIIRCADMEELPRDSTTVYLISEKQKGFVQGNAFQYAVFQLESEPTDWLNANSFENSLDEEKSKRFERSFLSVLMYMPDKLGKIPQEFLPNFDEQFYYLKTDDVYFVYLPQDLLLITIIPND